MEQASGQGEIDFTSTLDTAWYNFFEPAPGWLFSKTTNRSTFRNHPASSLTLHSYQSFGDDIRCGIFVQTDVGGDWHEIASADGVDLLFGIGGGAEIPHFTLKLRLKSFDSVQDDLYFVAVWTAWGDQGYDAHRVRNDPRNTPDPTLDYSFSSRLHNVRARQAVLDRDLARICGGAEGKPCYKISWKHYHPPYCSGFRIPEKALETFTDSQKNALKTFRKLGSPETAVRVVTVRLGRFLNAWKYMTAMPVPTPAPYPYYSCRFDKSVGCLKRISELPPLQDKNVQEHHRSRLRGWVNAPPSFKKDPIIADMHPNPPLTFVNEREYEVIKTIGFLREAEQQRICASSFNLIYSLDLIPAATIHDVKDGSLDEFFYSILDLSPRRGSGVDPDLELTLPIPDPGTPVRITVRSENTISKRLMRTHISSTSDDQTEWNGVVIAIPKWYERKQTAGIITHQVCIRIKRPVSLQKGGMILQVMGSVFFGARNPAYAQERSAMRNIIYGNPQLSISPNSRLKALILGRDNHIIKQMASTAAVSEGARRHIGQLNNLNREQAAAMLSTFAPGSGLMDLVTLVVGPPGTGKTNVSAHIARHARQLNLPILVVCASNYGLDVAAAKMVDLFGRSNPTLPLSGFYRLGTEFGESHETQMATDGDHGITKAGAISTQTLNELATLGVSPALFQSLKSWIESKDKSENTLSLAKHIISRLENAISSGSSWQGDEEEFDLLWDFLTWQFALSREGNVFVVPLDLPHDLDSLDDLKGEHKDLHDTLVSGFTAAWKALQKYYISHARVLFCTASTAGRKVLRSFEPKIIIVEEASQMTETACLNGIVWYAKSAQKIVLSGDTSQLPPTVISLHKNECYSSQRMSLFERLLNSGLPSIQLCVQYRMHPDIAEFVSQQFYGGSLRNHSSCSEHPEARRFRALLFESYGKNSAPGNSFFFSVQGSSVWQRKGHHSMFNPEYVSLIAEIVDGLVKGGCPQEKVLVLTYYAEEQRILSQLINGSYSYTRIDIKNVDSSQGMENDIVILSTCRPGGGLGLGFVSDRKRQCVAMSRAKYGLIVIGNRNMGGQGRSSGHQAWQSAVNYFSDRGRLINLKSSRTSVEKRLRIPNGEDFTEMDLRL